MTSLCLIISVVLMYLENVGNTDCICFILVGGPLVAKDTERGLTVVGILREGFRGEQCWSFISKVFHFLEIIQANIFWTLFLPCPPPLAEVVWTAPNWPMTTSAWQTWRTTLATGRELEPTDPGWRQGYLKRQNQVGKSIVNDIIV